MSNVDRGDPDQTTKIIPNFFFFFVITSTCILCSGLGLVSLLLFLFSDNWLPVCLTGFGTHKRLQKQQGSK